MELWEQTKRGYVLLSWVHSWAPTQTVVLAVRVSLPRGIVQWRHCGRVLQRRPVTLFAHSSEQDLRKLSGYSLHKHTAKTLRQQCRIVSVYSGITVRFYLKSVIIVPSWNCDGVYWYCITSVNKFCINIDENQIIKLSSKFLSDSWTRQTAAAQQHFCTGQSFDWNWTSWWRLELTMRRLCVVLLSTARRISRKRPTPRVRLLWECWEKTGRERWSDSEVRVFLEGGLLFTQVWMMCGFKWRGQKTNPLPSKSTALSKKKNTDNLANLSILIREPPPDPRL